MHSLRFSISKVKHIIKWGRVRFLKLNPYKIIYINPQSVKRYSGRSRDSDKDFNKHGDVIGGDWDISEFPDSKYKDLICVNSNGKSYIENSIFYESLNLRFNQNYLWEETPFIKEMVKRLPNNDWGSYSTIDSIKKKCKKIDDLYFSIKNDQLVSSTTFFRNKGVTSFPKCLRSEITVDIGRAGEMLLFDGKHRLCIAKLLKKERIPVIVMVKHKDLYNSDD